LVAAVDAATDADVDADTRVRRFLQELRWNTAYHRLAGGCSRPPLYRRIVSCTAV
jgi:hypothetical protein